MTHLTLSPDAKFSRILAPYRAPRDLASAVQHLTKLQNPSRIEPTEAPVDDR